ncbi:epigen isoform X1 [Triplophysa rosa]|uniref:epigen isoform X1 n=2 Tax=Triplophysa rosa TaxID=992332 RepID=UPI0025461F14|nr:epigen isoform X1 [Triplophysa rosa]
MPRQALQRCLHHAVFAVIVVLAAFCRSGHAKMTSEDVFVLNTTQLANNESKEEPQVLAIQKPCGTEHEGYCVNGACTYLSDLDIPICRCNQMYSGVRCEHMLLDIHSFSSPEEVIGISCGVILLLGALVGVIVFCFLNKRCRKTSPPYKNYGSENSV